MKLFTNVSHRAASAFENMAAQLGCTEPEGPLKRSGKFQDGTMTATYTEKRRFFSRIYKLEIALTLTGQEAPVGQARWQQGRQWQGDESVSHWLANHPELSQLATLIDIEQARYERASAHQAARIQLVTLPGCFIWTLLPPMHYFVKLKPQEIEGLRGLLSHTTDLTHTTDLAHAIGLTPTTEPKALRG